METYLNLIEKLKAKNKANKIRFEDKLIQNFLKRNFTNKEQLKDHIQTIFEIFDLDFITTYKRKDYVEIYSVNLVKDYTYSKPKFVDEEIQRIFYNLCLKMCGHKSITKALFSYFKEDWFVSVYFYTDLE